MQILAIDPGTSCGWCLYNTDTMAIYSGVWDLKPSRFESASMRFLKLKCALEMAEDGFKGGFDVISYEEVRRHMSTDAAHAYGGYIATIQMFSETMKIPLTTVTVQAVKQIATGKGRGKGTDKKAMLAAAQATWPGYKFASDDESDARFIALATERELIGKGKKS